MDRHIAAEILSAASEAYPRAVKVRRQMHRTPELSGQERTTARLVHRQLSSLALRSRYHVGRTGVSARISNGEGPTVVLRADLDALPVQEKTGVQFSSRRAGIMHACGHDMHAGALVGAAQALLNLRALWQGSVVFLFQPSEEVEPGGAICMIEEGAFPSDADSVFGLHVCAEHRTGQVGLKAGEECSGELVFDVLVKGKGGHGSAPHRTVDPIVCASSMIMDLQTLISRECPAVEPAVLTVGSLHAGTKNNVIPDEARFGGTIRTFSPRLQRDLKRRVAQSLRTAARSFRAGVNVTFRGSYPPGFNDPALAARALCALPALIGKSNVISRLHPTMFSEDFAYYQRRTAGLYLHLGVRPHGVRSMPGIHSATFLPDERALRTAIAVHAALAIDSLGG